MAKNIQDIFEGLKLTENGDLAYSTIGDKYADILFFAPYLQNNLDELKKFGLSKDDKLFAMMMRDPRFGLGYRKLGRELLNETRATPEEIVKCGRFDDLLFDYKLSDGKSEKAAYIFSEAEKGNELAKKWLPRFGSSKKVIASALAKNFGLSKQQYNKFVKVDTTEKHLTEHDTDKINFSHVPSLASIKYASRFANGNDTKFRYGQWVADVKEGRAKVNTSVTTCYDIYKNTGKDGFDPDIFFNNLEKIKISCLPIIDTSGSMCDDKDSIGKALAIGHYLATCSTYLPGKAVAFSSRPHFLDIYGTPKKVSAWGIPSAICNMESEYAKQIANLYTGDCSNTDFGKVMELMKEVEEFPDYLVVLSDMEFDCGSRQSTQEVEKLRKANGCNTKIIWWNFNTRATTAPEKTKEGNIFLSGWSPMLLKYLEAGFDNNAFISKLLKEYELKIK